MTADNMVLLDIRTVIGSLEFWWCAAGDGGVGGLMLYPIQNGSQQTRPVGYLGFPHRS